MKEYFKQYIADFLEKDLSGILPRNISLPDAPNRIISVIGARRVGKTYLLLQKIHQLRSVVSPSAITYLNFENDKLFPITLEKAQLFIDTYYQVFPENKEKAVYFFFDEIQNVPQWALLVRRLYDTEKCYIFLTGSSSRLLSKEIATSLRGRTITYEVFPLSFSEYCDWTKVSVSNPNSSKGKAVLANAFEVFLGASALPELAWENDSLIRQAVLHEYVNMVIYKDLVERHNLTQHTLIKHFIKYMAVNMATQLSINKLYNDFKSQGMSLSKNSLYDFLTYLEDSFIFFGIPIFSINVREQQRNPRKLYCIDVGLKLLMDHKVDKGRMLENLVFIALRKKCTDVYYFKSETEVDFCVQKDGLLLINVVYDMENVSTKNREVNGLLSALKQLDVPKGYIISMNDGFEFLEIDGKQIEIVPAWRWFLDWEGK